jgi:hypothetical protein
MVKVRSTAEDNVGLHNRVNSYGVQLRDLVEVSDETEHRFALEKRGNKLFIDVAFKEQANGKKPKS